MEIYTSLGANGVETSARIAGSRKHLLTHALEWRARTALRRDATSPEAAETPIDQLA
jgi:hypothetical protein